MPDYEITSPDGKKFIVTAPDGASRDEVLKYAQDQFSAQSPAMQTDTKSYAPTTAEDVPVAPGISAAPAPRRSRSAA